MRHGKNPTRRQKIFLTNNLYDPHNWLVVEDSPVVMVIKHRVNGRIAHIWKGGVPWQ